jgi:hypothetical protein
MEEIGEKTPLFKKMDQAIFDKIDQFKKSPNYSTVQDYYNSLDEDQQKIFKASSIAVTFILPLALIIFLWWQNQTIKEDLDLRVSIVTKANEILGQNRGLRDVGPRVLSSNPIDSQSMMTSRISNMLSGVGLDISKIQVVQFNSASITNNVLRSEAQFNFNNFATAELMNLLNTMITRERFRISLLEVKRNANSNMLQGHFQGIHFSQTSAVEEE